ncbi:MAG TPA: response regulator transcription factor [Candidatus Acidoferrum sp.]|nr:response regulator transcription factor [Candidatus Acidoferrum sp.]
MYPVSEAYHILVVEDNPGMARTLQTGLQREGFAVTWKANGAEAVQFAVHGDAHLTLMDVRLPDGSGFDFCRQMRQLGLKQPIIMLTVQAEETDKVLGLEMGADDYVTKPFSIRELVSRIRAQLRRAYGEYAAGQGDLLFVRDLVIDLTAGQVRRGRETLSLTPTEFRLLVYLARNPGQVLTRAQILDAVWGYMPELEGEHLINVHISRLREKIELDAGKPDLIRTVPGLGYRLVP